MKTLETERLILRPFRETDFDAVHAYASIAENIRYMTWWPNSETQTKAFISHAITLSRKNRAKLPLCCRAEIRREAHIGAQLVVLDNGDRIGWILHRDYWKQGFGTEMGKRRFGFRVGCTGSLPAVMRKTGSYRVMERIGMRGRPFS